VNLDGLPPFVADSLRGAMQRGMRWWVVVAPPRGVRMVRPLATGDGAYVAFLPGHPEAVLRKKDAAGLRDWRARRWNMFGGRTPIIVQVAPPQMDILLVRQPPLWVAIHADRPPTLEMQRVREVHTCIALRADSLESFTELVSAAAVGSGQLATLHQQPDQPRFMSEPAEVVVHDVTEQIPGIWRELLRPVPTRPICYVGGRHALVVDGGTGRLALHDTIDAPLTDGVPELTVGPQRLLGAGAPQDWREMQKLLERAA
jgi:hypothetical protein